MTGGDQPQPPTPESPSSNPVALALADAASAMARGDVAEAIGHLRRAYDAAPLDPEVNHQLGSALVAAGRAAEALPHFLIAVRDEPRSAAAALDYAAAAESLGRYGRAAVALRHAVRLQPEWSAARFHFARMLLRLRRVAEAEEQARAALSLDRRSPDARRLYGVILYCRRRFADAIGEFNRWSNLRRDDAEAHLAMARARLNLGQRRAAARDLKRAARLDPALWRAHVLQAQMALGEGKLRATQQFLKSALEARPDSAVLRARLADILLRRERFASAIAMARAALERDPDYAAAWLIVAQGHIGRGKWPEARAALEQASSRRPRWPELEAVRRELAAKQHDAQTTRRAERDARPIEATVPPELTMARGEVRDPPPDAVFGPEVPVGGDAAAMAAGPIWTVSTPRIGIIDHIIIMRALIIHDLRLRYLGNSFGLLMEFFRAIVVCIAHYYYWRLIAKNAPGNAPTEIYVLGAFSVWFVFSGVALNCQKVGNPNYGPFRIPGVTRMHLRVAKATWEYLSFLLFVYVAVLFLNVFGDPVAFPDFLLTCLIFFIAAILGFGYALSMEGLGRRYPAVEGFHETFRWLLFITSGIYHSVALDHTVLVPYLLFNPIQHLIEYERHAFDFGYPIFLVTLRYPALVAVCMLALGLVINRRMRLETGE